MHGILLQSSSPTKPYLESSATSTSTLAVIGAFECPAVGSSVFSSPFVELTTCMKNTGQEEKSIKPYPVMKQMCFSNMLKCYISKHIFSLIKVDVQASQFVNILYL